MAKNRQKCQKKQKFCQTIENGKIPSKMSKKTKMSKNCQKNSQKC